MGLDKEIEHVEREVSRMGRRLVELEQEKEQTLQGLRAMSSKLFMLIKRKQEKDNESD